MLQSSVVKAIIEGAGERVPVFRRFAERLYERRFARVTRFARGFCGVYPDFAAAAAAAPKGKPVGYDNSGGATLMEPSGPLWLSDYPVLFWLEKTLAEDPVILDIGGYVGISYYSFRKHLCYPGDLRWVIQDVQAVVDAGAEIARCQSSRGLEFRTVLGPGLKAHTVLALGALQFIEEPFAVQLSRLDSLPRHLIINKTPLSDKSAYATLQDLGPAACPYWVFNRSEFIGSLEKLGYQLMDEWRNAEFSCKIPFHRDHSVPQYSGLYFRLASTTNQLQ